MAPSHGFRLRRSGRRVVSDSSEQESAQSVQSFLSLCHILAFVRSELESTLVPSPGGLAIASLPLVSRLWTVLSWPHLMCLGSVVDRLMVVPHQLIGSGVCSPASTICPPGFMRQRFFWFSASVYSSGSPRRGHPSGSSLSQSSIETKALPTP